MAGSAKVEDEEFQVDLNAIHRQKSHPRVAIVCSCLRQPIMKGLVAYDYRDGPV
jgi:hypothetical protein